jgi:antitoxin YefM
MRPLTNMHRKNASTDEDVDAIRETLYLLSVPDMRESIREGLATPVEECEREPGW